MSRANLSLWRVLGHVGIDLLFACLILGHAAGRWFVRQVLARLAYALLFVLAALLLRDAEKGEPQPAPAE